MARLLFVSHVSSLGGPPHSLLTVLPNLKDQHQCEVIVPAVGSFSEALEEQHTAWKVLPFRLRYLPHICAHILKYRYDLIYGNNFSYASIVASWAAHLTGRPFIIHVRELLENKPPHKYRMLQHAQAVIAISQASANTVKRYLPDVDVDIVYNGITLHEFDIERLAARQFMARELRINLNDLVILSAGDIIERKNQADIVEIAIKMMPRYPQIHFCIVGKPIKESPYVSQLEGRIASSGYSERIHLIGFQKDIAQFMRGSDIFLHTPKKEPLGRVVLEALASEIPAVVYDCEGVNETLRHGITGFLTPPGDISAAVQYLERLVLDPGLRAQMGRQGRCHVEANFRSEQTANGMLSVIDRVLKA
jgi:glycosyltransferase involved in cell wall biosynthesis